MPQENVETILRAIDAANRADFAGFVSAMHPDVVWEVNAEGFPGLPGTYHGREGVRRWLETTFEPWESVRLEVEEIVEPSDDCLVGGTLMITRGHESGAETRLLMWHVLFFTDGLLRRRIGPYWTKDAALEAVGLREQAMSKEDVEIVRRAIDAYNRGQVALDLFDREIEWVTTGRFVQPDTYRGHEEVRRYLQALRDDFEQLHVEPRELVDAGDHVIAPVRFTGRGRLSSAPIGLEFTFVFSLRGGKVVRVRNYWEQTDAFEAAGLREQAVSQTNSGLALRERDDHEAAVRQLADCSAK